MFQEAPRFSAHHFTTKRIASETGQEEILVGDLSHRAPVSGDSPIHPESVEAYLQSKCGDALDEVPESMSELKRSVPPRELSEKAYGLHANVGRRSLPGRESGVFRTKVALRDNRLDVPESIYAALFYLYTMTI